MSKNINDIIANAKQSSEDATAEVVNDDVESIEQSTAVVVNDQEIMDIDNLPAELQELLKHNAAPSNELGSSQKTSLGVDQWLQPKGVGLTVKDTDHIIRPFEATIDYRPKGGVNKIKTVQIESLNQNTGDIEVNYVSTADDTGQMGSDGRPWKASVIEAYNKATTKARKYPYQSAQLIMVANEDVINLEGEVAFKKGTKFGHSTPRTGWNNFADLDNDVGQAGYVGQVIRVKVKNEKAQMKGRQPWGVLKFELLGVQEPEAAEAAEEKEDA